MWYLLYNGLLVIASPVILAILLAKPRCRQGLPQRFGFSAPPIIPDARPLVWMHAVSLGEVVAITPLVKELHRRHPDHRFVVSTATETGRDAVRQRLAGIAEHLYAPLDFPWSVSRAVARLRPALYVFIETELWPNLLRYLSNRGVPTIMVNGRLSSRSFARQQWWPVRSFYGAMLRSLRLCLMQSDRDAERIISLGADPKSVRRTGNIKFDQPLPTSNGQKVTKASLGIAEEAPLIVAGSTHPREEDMLVEAYTSIIKRYPTARLLLAPRHIERAEAVEAMIRDRGLTVRRRSTWDHSSGKEGGGAQVVILDTRGELALVYQEATVAFVGGTLIPIGGHNLLEPAFWGKPVLFGPYTDHCVEIADLLVQAGGGRRVTQVDDLTQQLLQLFEQPEMRARMGQAAQSVVRQNQGALRETIEAIDSVLASTRPNHLSSFSQESFPLMAGR
ncbi:MAG TPA: 3-deoxy-D-manno-octulosonic acid transferase, partial [Nitrospira sp.]|nr:3-deoxy-D-manno-octulosonic acid transferase [Nitrospira sp.]